MEASGKENLDGHVRIDCGRNPVILEAQIWRLLEESPSGNLHVDFSAKSRVQFSSNSIGVECKEGPLCDS